MDGVVVAVEEEEEEEEEGPRNITALIFHPGSRARRFAPVFNITPRSRMFYPPLRRPRDRHFPPPLVPPRCRSTSHESRRGIAPRNEFTILIWRAALAIYYLHDVGAKKNKNGDEVSVVAVAEGCGGGGGGGKRTNDGVPARGRRVAGGGRKLEEGRGRAALEGGATIREGRKYIVSICEHRDKTIIL